MMRSRDGGPQILFVDEEPAIQRGVTRTWATGAPEHRLACASDGAEALRSLDRGNVDLLITSLVMPLIDGVELLRHLANRRVTLPVIVVSEHEPPPAELRARAGCRVEFVREPLDREALLRRVHALLAEGPPARRGVTLADLLIVLRMERRTCVLRVTAGAEQGALCFSAGALIDAQCGENTGMSAVLEIFAWQGPVLALDVLVRARRPTVFATLDELLAALPRVGAEVVQEAAVHGLRRSVAQGGAMGFAGDGRDSAPVPTAPAAVRAAFLSLVPPAAPVVVPAASAPSSAPSSALPEATPGPAPARAVASWERGAAQTKIRGVVAQALEIDGAVAAALASWELDHSLGALGKSEAPSLEAAVTGHCRVMRAMATVMARVGPGTSFRDLLITAEDGRLDVLAPLRGEDGLFLWVAIDPQRGSLALARRKVQEIVGELVL